MALKDRKITVYANPVANLPDHPSQEGFTAERLKAAFDAIANEEVKHSINGIIDDIISKNDGASGADQVGATAVTDLDGTTVQAILESLRNKLKSVTDGTSGADFISATAIQHLDGTTVQAILESLRNKLKSVTDSASGADFIGASALKEGGATTVQGQLKELSNNIVSVNNNEANRVLQENARNVAETVRASEETIRKNAEDNRVAAESNREIAEQERVDADILRGQTVEAIETNYAPRLTAAEQQINSLDAENITTGSGIKGRIILGVIRNLGDGNGFQPITTGGHTPFNILSVETLTDRIRVSYSFTGVSTGIFVACPDEKLAQKGFFIGTSVASSYTDIFLKKVDDVVGYITKTGGSTPVFTASTGALSHIDTISDISWNSGSKQLSITHDKCYNPSGISVQTRDNRVNVVISSIDSNGLITYVKFYENYNFGSNIKYNGSAFEINTYDTSDNTEIVSSVWDDTNKHLRINHVTLDDNNIFVNLVPKNPSSGVNPYRTVLKTISKDYFDVEFYDNAGTLITIPDTKCCFTFNRSSKSKVPVIPPDNTVLIFNRFGSGKVPPSDVTYESSNIWLFGVMKV